MRSEGYSSLFVGLFQSRGTLKMDSITIAMASVINTDLGTLLATFLYKPYLLGYLDSGPALHA